MAGSRAIVDPPSFTPTPYGLLTTVEWPVASDERWTSGISYTPTCDKNGINGQLGGSTYDSCLAVTGVGGSPPSATSLMPTALMGFRGATSFEVYAEFQCSPVGIGNAQATAQTALAMAEPWQVERAFWTGQSGGQNVVFPHLASTSTVPDAVQTNITLQTAATVVTGVSGDTLNAATALGLLEGALANCYNGIGVIHIPEMLVPTLDSWGLIRAQGPTMRTLNGNKVAIGAGYPGTGPDGSVRAGNSAWMYATGNVFGFRSNVRLRSNPVQALDRSTNTMNMIAERTYVLGWDCCHFAIQVSLGVPKGT